MAILVTGGAGYIGSVAVEDLVKKDKEVVVIDNLVYGHREAVAEGAALYEGDIGDRKFVTEVLSKHNVDACMHFSAYAYVGESVTDPGKYFHNNLFTNGHTRPGRAGLYAKIPLLYDTKMMRYMANGNKTQRGNTN